MKDKNKEEIRARKKLRKFESAAEKAVCKYCHTHRPGMVKIPEVGWVCPAHCHVK